VLVRLNRAELGDRTCRVLGNVFIQHYAGQVVVDDYGFYALPSHITLIRQRRLIARVNSIDDIPHLKSQLHLFDELIPVRCTPADAAILAEYQGLRDDPLREDSDYNLFMNQAIGLA
jgi:hypothetical protein